MFDVSVFEVDFVEDAMVEGLELDSDVVDCCVLTTKYKVLVSQYSDPRWLCL